MQNAITQALRSLLMEEGRVCLPGIGTLLVVRQPALVSPIEGSASAPSARVNFNANLVIDDGRLLRETSREQLEDFLSQTNQALDAGRTVLLEGIGKLFRHADGEVRFTASGENFRKESFGLPAVALRPIVRKEKPVTESTAASLAKPIKKLKSSPYGMRYGSYLWYGAVAAGILLVVFLLFRLAGVVSSEYGDDPTAAVPQERLNVPPAPATRQRPAEEIAAERVRPAAPPRLNEAPAREELTAGAATAAAAPNVAIIAIGLYGRQRNVDKQTRRLTEAGYTPYTDREGRNTRVGVQVEYREETELRQFVREIRARYAEEAYVMRVNGEERRPE